MKNKLTYSDVLEETVKYYSEDPQRRAKDQTGTCSYKTKEGKMCAVGRCIVHPELFQEAGAGDYDSLLGYIPNKDTEITLKTIYEKLNEKTIEKDAISIILKDQYKHLTDNQFWQDLQWLHDKDLYWNFKGLTKNGKEWLNKLKEHCKKLDESWRN